MDGNYDNKLRARRSPAAHLFGAKTSINPSKVSPKKCPEPFVLQYRKVIKGTLLVFLEVSGIEKLCERGVSITIFARYFFVYARFHVFVKNFGAAYLSGAKFLVNH